MGRRHHPPPADRSRPLTRSVPALVAPFNTRQVFDGDQETLRDVAGFFAGGTGAVVNDWLIDGDDPGTVPLADRWGPRSRRDGLPTTLPLPVRRTG